MEIVIQNHGRPQWAAPTVAVFVGAFVLRGFVAWRENFGNSGFFAQCFLFAGTVFCSGFFYLLLIFPKVLNRFD